MLPRARQQRAILRDRRRDNRDAARYGEPLIRALNGWDLYIMSQWQQLHAVAQLIKPPGMSPGEMTSNAREAFRQAFQPDHLREQL